MQNQHKQLTHGSLFAGIGGFEISAKEAGIKTLWNCEIEPYPQSKTGGASPHKPSMYILPKDGKSLAARAVVLALKASVAEFYAVLWKCDKF